MGTVELGWRRLTFFEKVAIPDPTDNTQPFAAFKGLQIHCWAMGEGFVLLGEGKGVIFKVPRDFQLQAWNAYDFSLGDLCYANGYLVTIGKEEENGGSILKIWDINRWERNIPFCRLISKITVGKNKNPVTALAVGLSTDLNLVCVGMEDGSAVYAVGDIKSERSMKWKVLREARLNEGRLVGVAVAALRSVSVIFVFSETSVFSYHITNNDLKEIKHDAKGCEKNCWDFNPVTNTLVLANREMVYFYDAQHSMESNGRCMALARGSNKVRLLAHGPHISLLSQKPAAIPAGDGGTMCFLNVYDIEFRFDAFNCPIPSVCQMFVMDNELYMIGADGILHRLMEKPLSEKLRILIEKKFFDIAIGIAKRQSYGDMQSIYMKYGAYLYSKGDFENSVKQYMETVGEVEPSYVIKKFMDGARIGQLTQYLELLHARKLATGHHSMLLLSGYIKINAKEKIDEFVENCANFEEFNIEKAIKVLRSSGYSKTASLLALRNGQFDAYLAVLFEDLEDHAGALKFISRQPVDKMCGFLEKYGSALLENNMEALVTLVKKVIEEKPECSTQLIRVLITRPECLEAVYNSHKEALQFVELDPKICTVLIEQKLSKNKQKIGKTELTELLDLVSVENAAEAIRLGREYSVSALAVFAFKMLKQTDELTRFLLHEGDLEQIIEMCDEKLLKDMWIELVTHFSRRENLNGEVLIALLNKAKASKSLHPLVLLEVLSRNESLVIADVKEYIVSWLEEQEKFIREHESQINENEVEIERIDKRAEGLENSVQIFQTNKCSACDAALQIPSIHFLCGHSYHSHCFESYSDGKETCPACLAVSAQSGQKTAAPIVTSHSTFQAELQNAPDAIAFISDYIARGIFQSENSQT